MANRDVEQPLLAPASEREHEHTSKREEIKSGIQGQLQRLSDYFSQYTDTRQEFAGGRRTYALWVLVILFVIQLVAQADQLSVLFLKFPLIKDLGLKDSEYALLVSYGFLFLYAISYIPMGRLADTTSKKQVLASAILIWSLATAGIGLAHKYWHVVAARVGQGVAQAAVPVTAYPLIAAFFPAEWLPLANSFFACATYLGGTGLASVSRTLGHWFHLTWRGLLIGYGIIGAVLVLIFYPTVVEVTNMQTLKKPEPIRPTPSGEEPPRSFREALVEGTSEDARKAIRKRELTFEDAVGFIVSLRSGWRTYVAAGFRAMGSLLFAVYAPAFLIANFPESVQTEHSAAKTAYTYGMIATFVSAGSALLGGWITTQWQKQDIRAPALVPALGGLLAIPFLLTMFYCQKLAGGDESQAYSIAMWSVGLVFLCSEVWMGPTAAIVQQTNPLVVQGTAFGFYSAFRALIGGAGPALILFLEGVTDSEVVHKHKKYTIIATIIGAYLLSAISYYFAGQNYGEDVRKKERFEHSGEVPESDVKRRKALEYGFAFLALVAAALAWSTLHV